MGSTRKVRTQSGYFAVCCHSSCIVNLTLNFHSRYLPTIPKVKRMQKREVEMKTKGLEKCKQWFG